VYVGGVPDYGYDGEGLKISDITPNSPAQKAGLKAEDIIIQFGETTIKNIYDYTGVLSKYKPDDVVTLVVKRGAETITLPLTLGTKRDVH
jgi:S1-C subfamily serine protease